MLQNKIAYRGPDRLGLGIWRYGFKIWGSGFSSRAERFGFSRLGV